MISWLCLCRSPAARVCRLRLLLPELVNASEPTNIHSDNYVSLRCRIAEMENATAERKGDKKWNMKQKRTVKRIINVMDGSTAWAHWLFEYFPIKTRSEQKNIESLIGWTQCSSRPHSCQFKIIADSSIAWSRYTSRALKQRFVCVPRTDEHTIRSRDKIDGSELIGPERTAELFH